MIFPGDLYILRKITQSVNADLGIFSYLKSSYFVLCELKYISNDTFGCEYVGLLR